MENIQNNGPKTKNKTKTTNPEIIKNNFKLNRKHLLKNSKNNFISLSDHDCLLCQPSLPFHLSHLP